ncbi:hypothetical protein [Agromyces bauzanensis]|uniref:Mucin-associated surface protein n=1 Tax=Agromyces bauzanensis TaxID=1308924 RepID=A0A917PJ46_9MICO|nr:hypothetical protein [Agromyces bauzanensis]GGJ81360.1 hypothetical protein GCM10011372_19730 [Agromyces bauzanensis]
MIRSTRLRGRRAALPAAAIAVALTFGLSACGASTEETTAALHASVVQVAERAAAGDYAGALAELALLERDLAAAVDAGGIDPEREQRIRAAMELVRADLEAAEVATTTPEPEPSPDSVDSGNDGTDAPGNSGDAPGNSGDKGKGKNKGDD